MFYTLPCCSSKVKNKNNAASSRSRTRRKASCTRTAACATPRGIASTTGAIATRHIATARRNSALYYDRNTRLVMEYLLQHPCVDCGEADPLVLQFDHREPATKRREVSCMIRDYAWPQVEAEIAKCDVRCANCHQRRTAHQLGFRKVFLAGAAGFEPAKPLVLETSALPIELRP